MKKKILVTCGSVINPMGNWPAFVINKDYMNAVLMNGGIPIMVGSNPFIEDYAEMADGLIITGGESVHPRMFGETYENLANREMEEVYRMRKDCDSARDELDGALFEAFRKKGKPILGICRGHQFINAITGGKNMLNFPRLYGGEHNCGVVHDIIAEPDSVLGQLFGTKFKVNSYHCDCAVTPGPEMRVTARSEDGIVESIEHISLPIVGVQFHPERMRGNTPNPMLGPNMDVLFRDFIEKC